MKLIKKKKYIRKKVYISSEIFGLNDQNSNITCNITPRITLIVIRVYLEKVLLHWDICKWDTEETEITYSVYKR